jgi:hypothetical protein
MMEIVDILRVNAVIQEMTSDPPFSYEEEEAGMHDELIRSLLKANTIRARSYSRRCVLRGSQSQRPVPSMHDKKPDCQRRMGRSVYMKYSKLIVDESRLFLSPRLLLRSLYSYFST